MRYMMHMAAILGLAGLGLVYGFNGKWIEGLAFLAGAATLAVPIVKGGFGNFGDAEQVMTFFRNPAGAIVDTVIDRAGDAIADEPESEKKTFDVDAAFDRYMARRDAGAPAPNPKPQPTGFGRKGL